MALLSTESTGWGAVVGRAMLAFTHVLLGNYGKKPSERGFGVISR